MKKIEDCENPVIRGVYMVRHIFVNADWIPVFSHKHKDDERYNLNPNEHYHVDWRFASEQQIINQRKIFSDNSYNFLPERYSKEYFAAYSAFNVIEQYRMAEYKRDFDAVPEFPRLVEYMVLKGTKMKKMICPHHGTNMKSCRISINGIVQCPQHGLKWNIKNGDLVI